MSLYAAADAGDLARVMLLVEQGEDKNQISGGHEGTALSVAAFKGYLDVVRYLVEQGADMEKADRHDFTPLLTASCNGKIEVVQYLLEQGADRDKADNTGSTSLHYAAQCGHLEIAKLLMVYGADLNTRTFEGRLPIDDAWNEEIRQAIRDEPRRRMDHGQYTFRGRCRLGAVSYTHLTLPTKRIV